MSHALDRDFDRLGHIRRLPHDPAAGYYETWTLTLGAWKAGLDGDGP